MEKSSRSVGRQTVCVRPRRKRMPVRMIDLGWCMGRLFYGDPRISSSLTIMSPVDGEDGSFIPATSIQIYGNDCLLELKKALDEMFKEKEEEDGSNSIDGKN